MKTIFSFIGFVIIALPAMIAAQTNQNSSLNYNLSDSLNNIRLEAANGHAEAQYQVGLWYAQGLHSIKQNYDTAAIWWSVAAKQRHLLATRKLAECYQYGLGVTADSTDASRLYIAAIRWGDNELLSYLDSMSSAGNLFSSMLLAYCYKHGVGCKRNMRAAAEAYSNAAQQGKIEAYILAGEIYLNQHEDSIAFAVFNMGAKHYDIPSIYYVGKLTYDGRGTERDAEQGFRLLMQAAEQGYAAAQRQVAEAYYNGVGVACDYNKSFEWYLKSAQQNYFQSLWPLATIYRTGNGTTINYEEALYWTARAAQMGYHNKISDLMTGKNPEWKNEPFANYLRGLAAYYNGNLSVAEQQAKILIKAKRSEGKVLQTLCLMKSDSTKYIKKLASLSEKSNWAAYELALCYIRGGDINNALPLLHSLEKKEYLPAMLTLANMYYEGLYVEKNLAIAVPLYLKAEQAHHLDVTSANHLAECYREGYGGIRINNTHADQLIKQYSKDPIIDLFRLVI